MCIRISVILKAMLLLLAFTSGYAQEKPASHRPAHRQTLIYGRVVDVANEPLPGVSIIVKGTSTGVQTDVDGTFLLSMEVSPNTELVLSYLGMEQLTVAVKDRPEKGTWTLTMREDMHNIEEVVVTGYQNIKKNELTGAVKQVKAADVMQSAKLSIDQMLAGQIAGMSVITSSGEPSATAKIRIRGTSAIISNRAPLWVLDGIILEDVNPGQTIDYSNLDSEDAAYLIGNAIAGINPQDIESINVLKDAAATALYGVQAANGVIVVTTKKGRAGPPSVSYNGSVAVNMRDYYANLYLMNSAERVQLSMDIKNAGLSLERGNSDVGWEALQNAFDTKGPFEDYEKVGSRQIYNEALNRMVARNTDWYALLFRNALTQNHSVSMNGGNENITYYASLGYTDAQGTAIGSDSKRYTGSAKINTWLSDRVYVNFQVYSSMSTNDGFYNSVNPDEYARTTARTIPAFYNDGRLFYYKSDRLTTSIDPSANPITLNFLNELKETGSQGRSSDTKVQLNLRWNIWDKLRYEFGGSVVNQHSTTKSWASDHSHSVAAIRGYNYNDPSVTHGSVRELSSDLPYGGTYSSGQTQQESYTLRNELAYEKEVVKNHVASVMAISEIRSVLTEGYSGMAFGWRGDRGQLISPQVTEQNWSRVLTYGTVNPRIKDNTKNYVSWLGSASYSFKSKLMFNGNIRMDGSNQFGDNPKYRFLPVWSVSGRYILTEERFLKNNPVLSYLALRASYGVQGSVDAGTSPDLVAEIQPYDSNLGLDMSSINMLPNPDLRWQKTRSYNVGVDFSLWDKRIGGAIDAYKKMGTDMIIVTQISQVTGIDRHKINAGDLENTGIEFDLTGYPIRNKNWELSVNLIYSYNKNELTKATLLSPKNNDEVRASNTRKVSGDELVVGESLNTIYAWRFAGLDHETGLPIFYESGSATSIIDPITRLPSTLEAGGVEVPNYTVYREKADLVKVGVSQPPSTGGINLGLRYKNVRIRGGFTYSLGAVKRLPALNSGVSDLLDPTRNTSKEYINRWKKPGDEQHTNIPAFYNSDTFAKLPLKKASNISTTASGVMEYAINGASLYNASDVRIASTDNIRMNSLTLSYLFPASWMKRVDLSDAMLSLQVTNLFLIADDAWHGRDPEQSNSANASLPKTFTLNLNVNF